MLFRLIIPATLVSLAGCTDTPDTDSDETTITIADYARAEALISHNLGDAVRNGSLSLHWSEGEGHLYYRRQTDTGEEQVKVDLKTGAKSVVPDDDGPSQRISPIPGTPGHLVSPGGAMSAFVRDHNLWIRDADSGAERQLTSDGAPFFEYGGHPDQYRLASLVQGRDFPLPPAGTHWSPDGRWLIAHRLDERAVENYPFLESAAASGRARPKAYHVRVPLLGDKGQRQYDTFVFDTRDGSQRELQLPDGFALDYFGVANRPLAWSVDAEVFYVLAASLGAKEVRLLEVDAGTGSFRTVIEERIASSVSLGHSVMSGPNVHLLPASGEFVWYSEEDGWGHLYLHDLASGDLKRRLTKGDWTVWQIEYMDETDRQLFFTAADMEGGSDPYLRRLYRVPLDGGDLVQLTPELADHDISLSPGAGNFVDTYSTVSEAPTSVLRSAMDGTVIAELETADASRLLARGWRPPTRVALTAADGETDIYAAVYLPADFDPEKRYPVIDAIYGGPVSIVVPRSFRQAYVAGYQQPSLAELGFIVVSIDGRGTPYRSRAFRETGYGNFADAQLEDHVTALRQLAEMYPSMDLDRIGIFGHSNGGYMTARAMLKYPDFYKVGIASAGPHNFQGLPGTGMPWMGIPEYADGNSVRSEATEVPSNYAELDNANLASELKGRLLLIAGDMDNTAFPALTVQLGHALVEANKDFDMLYLPNETHRYFVSSPYVMRRVWNYFVEHLHGTTPPRDYVIRQWEREIYN